MILQMRKLRHIIDIKYLAQDHTASKLWSWDLNSDILAPGTVLLSRTSKHLSERFKHMIHPPLHFPIH